MNAYKVTVTRTFDLLVCRTADELSAQRFAEELIASGQIDDADWEQSVAVAPYEVSGE